MENHPGTIKSHIPVTKVTKLRLDCHLCKQQMKSHGTFQTCPPQFVYKCDKCGYTETTTESYPKIIYQ
jgi:tRNA(Ile2) C34 agmatinyltransferase TiaS